MEKKLLFFVLMILGGALNTSAYAERHWSPPANSPAMMHIAGTLLIDGMAAQVGDEVAVFDSSTPPVLVGSFLVTKTGFYGDLVVVGNDPNTLEDEGAEQNEALNVRVWHANSNKEYRGESIALSVPPELTGGTYKAATSFPLLFDPSKFYRVDISATSK